MWEPNFGDEGPNLSGAVYQALGAASMCWLPRPSDQIFDTEQATDIAEGLLGWLRETVAELRHAPACPGDTGCWCPISQMLALWDGHSQNG